MCAQDWSHPHDVDPWQGDQCGSLQHCHYDYHHHHHQHHHIIIIIIITIIIIDICYAHQGDRLPNVGQDPLRRGNVEGGTKSKKRLKGKTYPTPP